MGERVDTTNRTANVSASVNAKNRAIEGSARLLRWAANASWNAGPPGGRKLKEITLEHVLARDTCSPIALRDFEHFLAHCDYSLENLHFVVWFLHYQARFHALPLEDKLKSKCPTPSPRNPPNFTSAKPSLSINTSLSSQPLDPLTPTSPAPAYSLADPSLDLDLEAFYAYASETNASCSPWASSSSPSHTASSSSSPSALTPTSSTPPSTLPVPPPPAFIPSGSPLHLSCSQQESYAPFQTSPEYHDQPLRAELARALATFVLPASRKELLLDARERDACLLACAKTTHPDALRPIYTTALTHLRLVSLPRFLLAAGAPLVNRPRQLVWYACATANIILGLVLSLAVIFCPVQAWRMAGASSGGGGLGARRCWRLLGWPFFAMGVMQWYAAYRAFCARVFFRGAIQLRAWELDALPDDRDGEGLGKEALEAGKEADKSAVESERRRDRDMVVKRIAPFLSRPGDGDAEVDLEAGREGRREGKEGKEERRKESKKTRRRRRRPPVFGPERVVEDATIRAVHAQAWRDLLWVTALWALLFAVVVLSVPGVRVGGARGHPYLPPPPAPSPAH